MLQYTHMNLMDQVESQLRLSFIVRIYLPLSLQRVQFQSALFGDKFQIVSILFANSFEFTLPAFHGFVQSSESPHERTATLFKVSAVDLKELQAPVKEKLNVRGGRKDL